ncbi:unnamed protein product, partial [Ectocarpus sp. 12 AP-2014]
MLTRYRVDVQLHAGEGCMLLVLFWQVMGHGPGVAHPSSNPAERRRSCSALPPLKRAPTSRVGTTCLLHPPVPPRSYIDCTKPVAIDGYTNIVAMVCWCFYGTRCRSCTRMTLQMSRRSGKISSV